MRLLILKTRHLCMVKFLTIVGARPQFVKAAVLSREISTRNDIHEVLVHTGQHFDSNMSSIFFEQMEIPKPKYNLDINSLSHGAMTGRMLEELESIMLIEKPDWVLVYGDTNSTLAGALAAKKLHIKIAHIEAGLRSFNDFMPEEVNRILTDRISDTLFCPTKKAALNLTNEGYNKLKVEIHVVGDIMYDAALFYEKRAVKPSVKLNSEYLLCTVHRAENTDNITKLKNIIDDLNTLNSHLQIVMPLHPRTRKILAENKIIPKFRVLEPIGYLEMIYLLKKCSLIATDSGGMQKEAYFFKKPCITLRDQTEWTELIDAGVNNLVDVSLENQLFDSALKMKNTCLDFSKELYGDGQTAKRILNHLIGL